MSGAGAPAVLVVTGLLAEARIARGPGMVTVAGGGDAKRLARSLAVLDPDALRGVLSFGIAGGLAPGLAPGTVIVADGVECGEARRATDPAWRQALRAAVPCAQGGDLVGLDRPVAKHDAKRGVHARTGALAVDMESHVAARFAARHGLPFAILRAVADPAERSLPRAALVGMRPDGGTDVAAVLAALVRRPGDLGQLIRTALDARSAFAALRRCRSQAGDGFGCRRDRAAATPS